MIVKVRTTIAIEVMDVTQAEQACATIDAGLAAIMTPFPAGEVVSVYVTGFVPATEEEIAEKGWSE